MWPGLSKSGACRKSCNSTILGRLKRVTSRSSNNNNNNSDNIKHDVLSRVSGLQDHGCSPNTAWRIINSNNKAMKSELACWRPTRNGCYELGSNPGPLDCESDSLPLDHCASPASLSNQRAEAALAGSWAISEELDREVTRFSLPNVVELQLWRHAPDFDRPGHIC